MIFLTLGAFTFPANKDTDMKNVAQLQAKFIALYEEMYGFAPDFGSFKDWQDTNWLIRMYNDLWSEYNRLPDEIKMW